MRDQIERLRDILEAIDNINRYASRGSAAFEADELIQRWIVSHLQIIGEACRAISADLRDKHPEIPWSKIIGMRHILVHDYFEIDSGIVWSVVENELPQLRTQIQAMVDSQV